MNLIVECWIFCIILKNVGLLFSQAVKILVNQFDLFKVVRSGRQI